MVKSKKVQPLNKITAKQLQERIEWHVKYSLSKRVCEAHKDHLFIALAMAIRDLCIDNMFDTARRHQEKDPKRVYYLSLEYLLGRLLPNNLYNFEIMDLLDQVHLDNPIPLKSVLDCEYDPALGNGGLGRLAACILDSMATEGLPGYGYGINYQFGLFKQYFENGWQKERADSWLERSSPWQIERADRSYLVQLGGRVVFEEQDGHRYPHWIDTRQILGIPFDMPIVGYGGQTVNYLRLFSAHSTNTLDIETFNKGGYVKAVEQNIQIETISKVLYPSDDIEQGKYLRLIQQYFFVSCVINDILRRFSEEHMDFEQLPEKVVIQLNDTHPTLAIVELMRVLTDVYRLDWDKAWHITQKTMAYTNHTLLPEALEKWPVAMFEKILPRHLLIIYEINDWLMRQVMNRYPGDTGKLTRMSLIEEGPEKKVRMANLAIAGSFSVNGVAEIHTELVKHNLVPDFYDMWPERFNNKTNGVTPRRWLLASNQGLAKFITGQIGDKWITDLSELKKLIPLAQDKKILNQINQIKFENKERLATLIEKTTGVVVNPNALFDCQVKRIHEYKRQLLNALHIIHQYLSIIEDGETLTVPRVYVFGGKAAPSYEIAKLIIKLINNIAKVVNNDPRVKDQLKIAFIPDYKVSVAEVVFPGADVSEQISTAGFEASGTSNMKFAMNGALTIGTLDGANVEILQKVGAENFYLFGLTAEEVHDRQMNGTHRPWDYYNQYPHIKRVMDSLTSGLFTPGEDRDLFVPLFQSIMFKDYYMILADFESYIATQERLAQDYKNKQLWARKALLNIANSGKFSIDRTVREYAKDIWHVKSTVGKK
ncbi:MAG: glycogen/starch/alpha-glucan phosphorylase [Alphaproteobacteria bacterium]|nr:glycogen/starch/alpha-glucan phosphorylase [Alphaproteobacteria bacterium]